MCKNLESKRGGGLFLGEYSIQKSRKFIKRPVLINSHKLFTCTLMSLYSTCMLIPTLTDEDGNEALTGAQKADMLNKFFSNCFNHHSAPLEDVLV